MKIYFDGKSFALGVLLTGVIALLGGINIIGVGAIGGSMLIFSHELIIEK